MPTRTLKHLYCLEPWKYEKYITSDSNTLCLTLRVLSLISTLLPINTPPINKNPSSNAFDSRYAILDPQYAIRVPQYTVRESLYWSSTRDSRSAMGKSLYRSSIGDSRIFNSQSTTSASRYVILDTQFPTHDRNMQSSKHKRYEILDTQWSIRSPQ